MKPTPAHLALSNLGLAIEQAPLPMATVEGAGHLVRYVNPAFCALMNKSAEQLVGKPFADMVQANDECLARMERVYRTGQSESYTERQHSSPHSAFWSCMIWPVLAENIPVGVMIQVTETAQFHEKAVAMNEALVLGSLRQHELTEAADSLNVRMQAEITERKAAEELLRRNHDTFFNLIENAPFGLYVVDAQFRLRQVSSASRKAFSSVSPLIGRDFEEVVRTIWSDPFASEVLGRFRHTMETGEPYAAPSSTEQRRDITDIESYDWKIERVSLPDGQFGVVCYFYDITELKQAEAALRESEERFRTLFELGPVAVYSCDASGVIQNFNLRAAELWGRRPVLGDTEERFCGSFKLFRPDGNFMPHEQCPMAEVLSGKTSEVRDAEVLIERPDGSLITVVVNIRPLRNERGEATGAINCFYDISERKKAEEELRKWEYIFDHAGWAVVAADPETNRIILANPAFAAMHGFEVEEMLGKPIADTLSAESRAEFPKHVDGANNQGDYIYELTHIRKDGTVFPALTHVSALRDAKGRLLYRAATVRDITERKEAEQRQLLLPHELAHRGKNLLTVIISIAARSLAGTRPLNEARDVLIYRLHALARSQALLITEGFEGAPLSEVVRLEVEPFTGRVEAAGPDVMLNPRFAQTFALLVHELATNAAKYGALSGPDGRIAINWFIEGVGAEARFRFQWQELDGPPVVPPTRQGFGRTLIEKVVAQEFGVPPKIRFAPEGVSYEIDALLSVVASFSPVGVEINRGSADSASGAEIQSKPD